MSLYFDLTYYCYNNNNIIKKCLFLVVLLVTEASDKLREIAVQAEVERSNQYIKGGISPTIPAMKMLHNTDWPSLGSANERSKDSSDVGHSRGRGKGGASESAWNQVKGSGSRVKQQESGGSGATARSSQRGSAGGGAVGGGGGAASSGVNSIHGQFSPPELLLSGVVGGRSGSGGGNSNNNNLPQMMHAAAASYGMANNTSGGAVSTNNGLGQVHMFRTGMGPQHLPLSPHPPPPPLQYNQLPPHQAFQPHPQPHPHHHPSAVDIMAAGGHSGTNPGHMMNRWGSNSGGGYAPPPPQQGGGATSNLLGLMDGESKRPPLTYPPPMPPQQQQQQQQATSGTFIHHSPLLQHHGRPYPPPPPHPPGGNFPPLPGGNYPPQPPSYMYPTHNMPHPPHPLPPPHQHHHPGLLGPGMELNRDYLQYPNHMPHNDGRYGGEMMREWPVAMDSRMLPHSPGDEKNQRREESHSHSGDPNKLKRKSRGRMILLRGLPGSGKSTMAKYVFSLSLTLSL